MAWDPLRDLLALQERATRSVGTAAASTAPPVDLYETADSYVLMVEVPGVAREAISLSVRDGHLTLAGQRPHGVAKPDRYHRIERSYGAFARTFAFETPIDGDAISADLKDGVLTVHVPKREAAGPRKVTIE